MEYEALTNEFRSQLLAQRLLAHEKAYFEIEVQLDEVRTIMSGLSKEDLERAQEMENTLLSQLGEVKTRIQAVKSMQRDGNLPRSSAPVMPTPTTSFATTLSEDESNVKSLRNKGKAQR